MKTNQNDSDKMAAFFKAMELNVLRVNIRHVPWAEDIPGLNRTTITPIQKGAVYNDTNDDE